MIIFDPAVCCSTGVCGSSGKSDEEFIKTAKAIEEKIKDLARRIQNN